MTLSLVGSNGNHDIIIPNRVEFLVSKVFIFHSDKFDGIRIMTIIKYYYY